LGVFTLLRRWAFEIDRAVTFIGRIVVYLSHQLPTRTSDWNQSSLDRGAGRVPG
jgi:hypothetical protein